VFIYSNLILNDNNNVLKENALGDPNKAT